jgi:hypothetical protein
MRLSTLQANAPNLDGEFGEVVAIFAGGQRGGEGFKLVDGEKATIKRGLLWAAELHALALLDGLNVGGGFVEAGAGARVEPSGAAAEALNT